MHLLKALTGVLALPFLAYAGQEPFENLLPCKDGEHSQPEGEFAVYAFCDDALGTNISILYSKRGDPKYGKWTLTRRFWQDGPWSADVSAIGWVPNHNQLVVVTSEIYGAGSVFLLDLEKQTYSVIAMPKDCGSTIEQITEQSVTLVENNCDSKKTHRNYVVKLPNFERSGDSRAPHFLAPETQYRKPMETTD